MHRPLHHPLHPLLLPPTLRRREIPIPRFKAPISRFPLQRNPRIPPPLGDLHLEAWVLHRRSHRGAEGGRACITTRNHHLIDLVHHHHLEKTLFLFLFLFARMNEGTMWWYRNLWFGGVGCCLMVAVVRGEHPGKRKKKLAETRSFLVNFF